MGRRQAACTEFLEAGEGLFVARFQIGDDEEVHFGFLAVAIGKGVFSETEVGFGVRPFAVDDGFVLATGFFWAVQDFKKLGEVIPGVDVGGVGGGGFV